MKPLKKPPVSKLNEQARSRGGVVEKYMADVLSGNVPACKWVKQAVKRHKRDLKERKKRGIYFDGVAAQMAIDFFQFLRHSKGEWAGTVVVLEPWQQFHLWVLFGWKWEATGYRRFRISYLEVARKNGKTTEAAGVGLKCFDFDGEPGAEVYTAATKKDQAKIAHSEAVRMVRKSKHLRRRFTVYKDNISCLSTDSKFEPLSKDSDSLDGLNIHCAIVDEVHAHKTRDLWDVIESATGSRRQPLLFAITTAGFNKQSICYELHTYAEQILDGFIEDDSFFALIYTLDEGDEWSNPVNWVKSNPNLGVSVKINDMENQARKAENIPAHLNNFLCKRLNIWTTAETRWIHEGHWKACGLHPFTEGDLLGRECYGGLDLSSTLDITALVLVFPPLEPGEPYYVLCRFWVPEEAMRERSRKDKVPYEAWVREGFIEATPGNVIDYNYIYRRIAADAEKFDLKQIAFDRWGATKVWTDLDDLGFTASHPKNLEGERQLVEHGQGFASMSPPTKRLGELVAQHKIAHGDNPVLTWMAGNLVVRTDPAENLKPDKSKSTEKIDGMVALIMGLDRAERGGGENEITQGVV